MSTAKQITIDLGGGHKIKWASQRRYGVIWLTKQHGPRVASRSDSITTIESKYAARGADDIMWLIDTKNKEDAVLKTNFMPIRPKETQKIIDAARKKANTKAAKKEKKAGGPCGCGCGGTTGGGFYLPGHDAKHKGRLIKEAIAGSQEARDTMISRGWLKFLDKATEIHERKQAGINYRTARKEQTERSAKQRTDELNLLKEAALKLRMQGRYAKSSPNYLRITKENAADIVAGRL